MLKIADSAFDLGQTLALLPTLNPDASFMIETIRPNMSLRQEVLKSSLDSGSTKCLWKYTQWDRPDLKLKLEKKNQYPESDIGRNFHDSSLFFSFFQHSISFWNHILPTKMLSPSYIPKSP